MVTFTKHSPLFDRSMFIPATSDPVEKVFSRAGDVLHPQKSSVTDESFEEMILLKCNVEQ